MRYIVFSGAQTQICDAGNEVRFLEMQSAHFDILVDVLLKCPRRLFLQRGTRSNTTTSGTDDSNEILPASSTQAHRARGIIDISRVTLDDVPVAIEDRLRKSKGIFSAQVNAFSKKLAVEFDPSIISLDKILKIITRRG
jgi:hypothetical protein